jgi:MIP family channel proteins
MRTKNETLRQLFAETLGTFILCVFGLASIAQFKLFADSKLQMVNFLPVNVAFGLGLTVAVLVVGKVSGGHLNPAVSLAMFLTGRLSLLKLAIYSLGQFLGAFLAACTVFVLYLDGMKAYPKGGLYSMDLAGIFGTYPNQNLSIFGGFFDQMLGSGVLVLVVMALTDSENERQQHRTVAFAVGATLTAIGCAFGYNTGFAVNPARDFAPRLFTLMAGWGTQTFTAGQYFFWIPVVAPLVGSVVAVVLYSTLIANHWQ